LPHLELKTIMLGAIGYHAVLATLLTIIAHQGLIFRPRSGAIGCKVQENPQIFVGVPFMTLLMFMNGGGSVKYTYVSLYVDFVLQTTNLSPTSELMKVSI